MSHDELWDQSKFQRIIRNIFYTEWKFEIIPNNFNPTSHETCVEVNLIV